MQAYIFSKPLKSYEWTVFKTRVTKTINFKNTHIYKTDKSQCQSKSYWKTHLVFLNINERLHVRSEKIYILPIFFMRSKDMKK